MSRGGDIHILTGMDAIINPDNIKPGIDLKELERQMVSGGLITQKIKDPQDRFNDELKDAASKLGISFGEFSNEKRPVASALKKPAVFASAAPTLDGGYSSGSNYSSSTYQPPDEESEESSSSSESEEKEDTRIDMDSPTNYSPSRSSPVENRFSGEDRPRYGGDLHTRTMEQQRREHIDSVMGGSELSGGFSFEKEKREDMKCAMLAEIDSLMSSLVDEDIDLSRIPKVDRNSDYTEVESILKMLRHKNDHTRYCSFAEEFLLFGAYALEDLFDGKRTWFGRYQPDLTGYHNTLNVKLKRMRHDTGQLVAGVMQDYNIGPGARVLLEIVPNVVLYSKMRKQQHNQPGLFSDEEMSNVTQNIRNYEN